jgi:hypothetical protein
MSIRIAGMSLAAAALALGACASTSGNSATKPVAAAPPAGCVSGTGSRLTAAPGNCAGFGRTYTREDIDNTGETTAGGALRRLDPTVTVTR